MIHKRLQHYDAPEGMWCYKWNETPYEHLRNSTFYKVENILVQRNQNNYNLDYLQKCQITRLG